MGCASSGPVNPTSTGRSFVDAAKETANDVAAKGEQTLQNVTDTAKEGITTGIETVKEAVGTAVTTAENSIGGVVSKIGETFHSTAAAAEDAAEGALGAAKGAADGLGEDVFETAERAGEGVATGMRRAEEAAAKVGDEARSKVDEVKEAVSVKTFGQLQDEVNESFNRTKESLKESLHIEDLDGDFDVLDEDVKDFERGIEDDLPSKGRAPTPAPSPPPNAQGEKKEEEPPPTFWEAAADAILLRRLQPFGRNAHQESDAETEGGGPEREEAGEFAERNNNRAQDDSVRFVSVPRLMENGNDIVRVEED